MWGDTGEGWRRRLTNRLHHCDVPLERAADDRRRRATDLVLASDEELGGGARVLAPRSCEAGVAAQHTGARVARLADQHQPDGLFTRAAVKRRGSRSRLADQHQPDGLFTRAAVKRRGSRSRLADQRQLDGPWAEMDRPEQALHLALHLPLDELALQLAARVEHLDVRRSLRSYHWIWVPGLVGYCASSGRLWPHRPRSRPPAGRPSRTAARVP